MMSPLAREKCVPCRQGERLSASETSRFLREVSGWRAEKRGGILQLFKVFKFGRYPQALSFVQKLGKLSDKNDHHPQIVLEWGKVSVRWWTHSAGGLHRNDFIMAAKTDALSK